MTTGASIATPSGGAPVAHPATAQRIGVPREVFPGEKRVATVPEAVQKLIKLGFSVAIESGAGAQASFSDESYVAAGATIVANAAELWATSDIVFKVRGPSADEVGLMREGGALISFIWPAQNPELMQQLAAKKATVLAIDALPRMLSRAQKMDALTSMAGVTGYRAVVEAANAFGRFFNGQITAAGKVPPAKVFIAGAGVAGLAAIGTAAGLGAIVRANDTRAEVADQVKSLGGEFVKVEYEEEGGGGGGYAKVMSEGFQTAQREMYARQAKEVDIIITTALIPGKPAPKLITAEMVRSMKPGSVIVDMAAEQGGNCELTEPGQSVVRHGVTIVGFTDLAKPVAAVAKPKGGHGQSSEPASVRSTAIVFGVGALVFWLIGSSAPKEFMSHFTVFVLACFVGYMVVWNVKPALHTPLMSVTNAISSIIAIGALVQISPIAGAVNRPDGVIQWLAAAAIVLTAINMFGGFAVTQRMLAMFRK